MKKSISCCLSHQNPSAYLFRCCCLCLVNGAWSVQISLLIQTRTLFHWRKRYYELWTHILVKNILMIDLFQLLMLTDGLEWCGLLWCFYQTLILTAPIHCRASIDSHSDGTHSLQSIHCWDTDAMLHFSKSDEEKLILIMDGLRLTKLSAHFEWTFYSWNCSNSPVKLKNRERCVPDSNRTTLLG